MVANSEYEFKDQYPSEKHFWKIESLVFITTRGNFYARSMPEVNCVQVQTQTVKQELRKRSTMSCYSSALQSWIDVYSNNDIRTIQNNEILPGRYQLFRVVRQSFLLSIYSFFFPENFKLLKVLSCDINCRLYHRTDDLIISQLRAH